MRALVNGTLAEVAGPLPTLVFSPALPATVMPGTGRWAARPGIGSWKAFLASGLIVCAGAHATAADQCLALDESGKAADPVPPAHPNVTSTAEDTQPLPSGAAALAAPAANIVGRYEAGGGSPWANIGPQEVLSVGFMQWNWATHSLTHIFLAAVPTSEIDAAPAAIVDGLRTLKKRATDKSADAQSQAAAVMADWTTAKTGDPRARSGVRRAIDAAWRLWLVRPGVKQVQLQLVDDRMRLAYSLSKKWLSDQGQPTAKMDVRLLASFFDLVVYNGGRDGLWVEHVRHYRQTFKTNVDIVADVTAWLASCENFVSSKSVADRRMYGVDDAKVNVSRWRAAVAANPSQFTDQQMDLFIYAYLRARRSVGRNHDKGFPGIYQVDVMNRRGALALGIGQVHGYTQKADPLPK
jgi:hypothetical protein